MNQTIQALPHSLRRQQIILELGADTRAPATLHPVSPDPGAATAAAAKAAAFAKQTSLRAATHRLATPLVTTLATPARVIRHWPPSPTSAASSLQGVSERPVAAPTAHLSAPVTVPSKSMMSKPKMISTFHWQKSIKMEYVQWKPRTICAPLTSCSEKQRWPKLRACFGGQR